MILALHAARGLAGRLHGRQQQRDEHADDGDDDEQLHERERRPNRTASAGEQNWLDHS
jgi:hypothetical protein